MTEQSGKKYPRNIPDPVIFGPSYPDLKLLLQQGRQIIESRTNQNLRLEPRHFTSAGTYTMGEFLTSQPLCRECRTAVGCSALIETWWRSDNGLVSRIELKPEVDIPACRCLASLRDYCPDSQKLFFEKFLQRHYAECAAGFEGAFSAYTDEHGPVYEFQARNMINRTVLGFPALLPEVWLAAIGSDRTADDESYLSEHPQRVDFVMFANAEKWVIEVDGPSHYASWDEQWRVNIADERVYTKNLRIERALRRQGWRLHRFSNLEVKEATAAEFSRLIRELPTGDPPMYGLSRSDIESLFPPSTVGTATDDDIPF